MLFTGIEPTRGHTTDAGFDLASRIHAVIEPGKRRLIATGTSVAIPDGYFGSIRDRSSMAVKGIHVLGGVIVRQRQAQFDSPSDRGRPGVSRGVREASVAAAKGEER